MRMKNFQVALRKCTSGLWFTQSIWSAELLKDVLMVPDREMASSCMVSGGEESTKSSKTSVEWEGELPVYWFTGNDE